jgi:hypothetical protein
MSVLPPGAQGTTKRTGRSGHAALAFMAANTAVAATRTAPANLPFAIAFMWSPVFFRVTLVRRLFRQPFPTYFLIARIRPARPCCFGIYL